MIFRNNDPGNQTSQPDSKTMQQEQFVSLITAYMNVNIKRLWQYICEAIYMGISGRMSGKDLWVGLSVKAHRATPTLKHTWPTRSARRKTCHDRKHCFVAVQRSLCTIGPCVQETVCISGCSLCKAKHWSTWTCRRPSIICLSKTVRPHVRTHNEVVTFCFYQHPGLMLLIFLLQLLLAL